MPLNAYREHHKGMGFGDHCADVLRNGIGSWAYITLVGLAVAVWIETEGLTHDIHPYPILNLVLSVITALQGIVILISARRQDQLTAALSEAIYQNSQAALKDTSELRQHLSILYQALELDVDADQVFKIIRNHV